MTRIARQRPAAVRAVAALLGLVVLAACGDEGGAGLVAGARTAPRSAPASEAPPTPPAPAAVANTPSAGTAHTAGRTAAPGSAGSPGSPDSAGSAASAFGPPTAPTPTPANTPARAPTATAPAHQPDAVRFSAARGLPLPPSASAQPAPTPRHTMAPAPVPPPDPVRVVQANLYTRMPDGKLAADLATAFAGGPDFVTLNEVGNRSDEQITPAGYALHRSTDSIWTAETPVLWRTDRWQELSAGTRYLTDRRVKWGVRAVNWVTVRNRRSGRELSVVSAHAPPTISGTRGLLPVYAEGLGELVRELSPLGAVLVGGDLNVGYLSSAWPTATWDQAGLAATYDVLGQPAGGTGDHHHATMDYVLFQRDHGLTPVRQGTMPLYSDHEAVWSDLLLR